MLIIFYLLLFLCATTHCDDIPTDEEIEVAFRKVEEALNDLQEVKSLVKEVKDSLATTPDYKSSALEIAKAFYTSVPMLKSDNGYTVAEGALLLAAGIAENIPGGTIIASVATLIASVIGIINTDKVGIAGSSHISLILCTSVFVVGKRFSGQGGRELLVLDAI